MRSILLITMLSLLSSFIFAGELGPKLKEALEGDAQSFDVVITLKKKLNGKKIRRFVKRNLGVVGQENVRRAVIDRLKEQSARDQESVRSVLSKLTNEEGKYLWAANSISLELSREAVTELLALRKVKEIELNVIQQFLEPETLRSKRFKKRSGKREIKVGIKNAKRSKRNKRNRRNRRNRRNNEQIGNLSEGENLPGFDNFGTYGLEVTQSDDVNNVLGITGKGVIVAVIDTGTQANHSEFAGNVEDENGNSVPKIVDGASFIQEELDEKIDGNNHGTHCAGTVAGNTAGVAPQARIMPIKALAANGSGSSVGIAQGIQFAVANGADVLSLSLGSLGDNRGIGLTEQAANNAVAAGAIVVCAAGNSGPNARTVGSPGSSPIVISVGAHDNNGNMANFSSRGPNADGEDCPDIAAPGVSIRSSIANGGFSFFSGTSMATPHVAGIAALCLEVLKPAEANGFALPENTTRNEFIKGLMTDSANVFGNAERNVSGAGLINAFNVVSALIALTTPPEPEPEPEPQETDFTDEKVIADTITLLREVYGNQVGFFRFNLNSAIEINQEERTAVVRLRVRRFVVSFASFNINLNFTLEHSNPDDPVDQAVFNYVVDEAGRQALENTLP